MDDCHILTLKSADGTALLGRHWETPNPKATMALVHGFGEHSGRYTPMAKFLTDNGVQVIAADLRGHGRSEGKRGVIRHYDELRDDLSALLARARQLHQNVKGPLVLYGHSMGGGIVLDHGFAPDPAIDAIIASAPLIALPEPVPGPVRFIAGIIANLFPNAVMKQKLEGEKISTLLEEQREYEQDALNHNRLSFGLARGLIETGEQIAARADLWSLPLMMIHSDQDQLTDFTASQDFAKIAGANFHALSDVAHEAHNDTSRAWVYQTVLDFIERSPVQTKG